MITVFVPAFNEQDNIRETVKSIRQAAERAGNGRVEIIVVNDGSSDQTATVTENLKTEIPELSLINNEVNLGVGQSMRKALAAAKYPKFIIVPGDNDMSVELLTQLFSNADRADLVMSYFLNREVRGVSRNIISTIFASIYMITFGIFVQYINGPCIYPTDRLRKLNLKANRFSIVVEATLKLLCSGASYYEVSGYMQKGLAGSTSLSWRNLTEVATSFLRLVWEIKLSGDPQFKQKPVRIY